MTIYVPNKIDDRYETVKQQILTMGAPQIRAYWSGDAWLAIEGSHRVAAAHELGIEPVIVEVSLDDSITDHDLDELPDEVSVEEILAYLYDCPQECYSFTI